MNIEHEDLLPVADILKQLAEFEKDPVRSFSAAYIIKHWNKLTIYQQKAVLTLVNPLRIEAIKVKRNDN